WRDDVSHEKGEGIACKKQTVRDDYVDILQDHLTELPPLRRKRSAVFGCLIPGLEDAVHASHWRKALLD
ncbi:MAG: hypothetical protein AAF408_19890, partial [Pseudomonadota bacterium]